VNYSIVSLLLAHSIQVIFSSDPPNVILCIILFGKTEEYEKCMVGLNAITREAWNTAQDTEDKREKIQALSLAKECYSMNLALLTNATAVDDAIRFVSQKSKENLKSSGEDEEEEADGPDYEEPRETSHTVITTNEVF
jgi:hypothetical protein